jgi:hypothetical protein
LLAVYHSNQLFYQTRNPRKNISGEARVCDYVHSAGSDSSLLPFITSKSTSDIFPLLIFLLAVWREGREAIEGNGSSLSAGEYSIRQLFDGEGYRRYTNVAISKKDF